MSSPEHGTSGDDPVVRSWVNHFREHPDQFNRIIQAGISIHRQALPNMEANIELILDELGGEDETELLDEAREVKERMQHLLDALRAQHGEDPQKQARSALKRYWDYLQKLPEVRSAAQRYEQESKARFGDQTVAISTPVQRGDKRFQIDYIEHSTVGGKSLSIIRDALVRSGVTHPKRTELFVDFPSIAYQFGTEGEDVIDTPTFQAQTSASTGKSAVRRFVGALKPWGRSAPTQEPQSLLTELQQAA